MKGSAGPAKQVRQGLGKGSHGYAKADKGWQGLDGGRNEVGKRFDVICCCRQLTGGRLQIFLEGARVSTGQSLGLQDVKTLTGRCR